MKRASLASCDVRVRLALAAVVTWLSASSVLRQEVADRVRASLRQLVVISEPTWSVCPSLSPGNRLRLNRSASFNRLGYPSVRTEELNSKLISSQSSLVAVGVQPLREQAEAAIAPTIASTLHVLELSSLFPHVQEILIIPHLRQASASFATHGLCRSGDFITSENRTYHRITGNIASSARIRRVLCPGGEYAPTYSAGECDHDWWGCRTGSRSRS